MLSLQNAHMTARPELPTSSVTADIITNDQIPHADEYKPLIVGYHNGPRFVSPTWPT